MKTTVSMLILLSWFSFLHCKPSDQLGKSGKESAENQMSAYNKYPDALYPVRIKGKWGYMNRKTEIVIPPTWDDADDFFEGFAKVGVYEGENGLYGFIDNKGQWLIQPKYQKAGMFSEGLAYVVHNDQYGFVDTSGNEVIHCQFQEASNFHGGYAAVKQNGWTGFISRTGEVLIEPQFTVSVQHPQFREGLAPVFGVDEKTGFIDTTGKWKIEPRFHSAGNFEDGMAWAMIQKDDDQSEYGFTIRGGFIDTTGKYIIDPIYEFSWGFSEGYAVCWYRSEDKLNKIWKAIDRKGEVFMSDLPYRNVGSFKNGLLPIQDEEMKWGFINAKGEVVVPPQYAGINHFMNGLARMETGSAFSNKIIYINERGEEVWKE